MTIGIRGFSWTLLGLVLLSPAQALPAQQRFSPAEIGQIVDVVLEHVVPPTRSLSCLPVSQRGVFLDQARTMRAFGYPAAAAPVQLHLRRKVKLGTDSLLSDCGPAPGGGKPCARLGSGVYVSIEPVSMRAWEGVVRASVFWPDRGDCGFLGGVARNRRASFVGFAAEVYLARAANGSWRFVRTGVYQVS